MKKHAKIRRYGLAFVALFVCLAIMATLLTFVPPYRALAVGPDADHVTLFENAHVPEKCKFGDPVTIPVSAGATVKVLSPSGKDITPQAAGENITFTAAQIGSYTVVYTDKNDADGASYSFNIRVTLEKEYFLKVDDNGADIKTSMKVGDEFTMPDAHVAYYDDNNVLRYLPDSEVTLTVKDSAGNSYDVKAETKPTFKPTKNGKEYFTYTASIGDEGKFYTKTYTTNVTSTYTDDIAPVLTVSGVSSSISINRPVTLPKATVTDEADSNVKIVISVLDPDNKPVRITDVDEYGYGYQKLNEGETLDAKYPEIKFDNDQAMTFYPLMAGQYTVTYTAYDDKGNVSSTKRFTPTASDSVAPVFQEIDDYMIPDTWGVNVTNKAGEVSSKIKMPIPFLVDNSDHMYPNGSDDKKLISLYFRITDADYSSTTIIDFKNILQETTEDAALKANYQYTASATSNYGEAGKVYSFNKDNEFEFDLSQYHRKDKDKKPVEDLSGAYTVYYRAEDQAGNRSTKSFTINVKTEYDDIFEPTIADIKLPKYISSADDSLNIPTPEVTDTYGATVKDSSPSSAKINVEYTIRSGDSSIKVKGGEKAEFVDKTDGRYLVIDKDKTYEKSLKLADKLYFCVKATDNVGNVAYNTEDGSDDYTKSKAVINVIASGAASPVGYSGEISYKIKNGDGWDAVDADHKIHTGDTVNAGGFTIATTAAMRKYTGFEIAVKNVENGNAINTTLETFTEYDEDADTATIYVKNITFAPGKAGKYYLVIRAFDVNDNNWVSVYSFDVEQSTHGGGTASATVISGTGSVNVKYQLHNETMKDIGEADNTYFVARKISGGVYSLMGSELTAKTQGSYSVADGYINATDIANYDYSKVEAYGNDGGRYTFSITDTAAPVIEVQGSMPSHVEKDEKVTLPVIFAYSDNGIADVKVTVKQNKDGKDVKVDYDEETKRYSFTGTQNGVYTVTVSATRASASEVSSTYSINVGKVTAPQFSVPGATIIRMKQGDTDNPFTYADIVLGEGEPEDGSGITITKKILDPSKEEVSGATVNGSWYSYHDKANNGSDIVFDKSGTYYVYYYAQDEYGNGQDTPYIVRVEVSASGTSSPTTFTTLSTVLIIVAVVLLAGVIIYVVRFRKVKK